MLVSSQFSTNLLLINTATATTTATAAAAATTTVTTTTATWNTAAFCEQIQFSVKLAF